MWYNILTARVGSPIPDHSYENAHKNTQGVKWKLENKKRAGILDEVRGFAIICMVVYHTMFNLNFFLGAHVPVFFDAGFDVIRDIFAGTFVFISGCVCRYSKNNFKRGAQCFFLGMIITFVTAFAVPDAPIYFGILHMLGTSMLLFGLLEGMLDKIPVFLGLPLGLILFLASYHVSEGYIGFSKLLIWKIPRVVYDAKLLFPLGFDGSDFSSTDYFPLMPWFFLFISGTFFGETIVSNSMPSWFYGTRFKFFAAAGRNSIWIYILHQPVLFLLFSIITNSF
jgi:uncharacterized membrane protein